MILKDIKYSFQIKYYLLKLKLLKAILEPYLLL
nr:MAG TPA: hypothetical protein [Caudoviricetes sp.]